MKNKTSGTVGVLIIVAVILILVLLGRYMPVALKTILIIAAIVIAAIIALIIVSLVLVSRDDKKKAAKGTPGNDLTEEQKKTLADGRDKLMEIRRKIMRISTMPVRSKANEVCGVIDKIFQALKEKPDKISSVRQFLNYYLPTLGKVLEKYDRLEDSHTATEEITENVVKYLTDVKTAMNKMYENLYESDKLDMSVEMEAMMLAVKRDGLIE